MIVNFILPNKKHFLYLCKENDKAQIQTAPPTIIFA